MLRDEGELATVQTPRAVGSLPVCLSIKPVGKPNAGNRHVRFDERGWETGRCRMAQATAPILDSTICSTVVQSEANARHGARPHGERIAPEGNPQPSASARQAVDSAEAAVVNPNASDGLRTRSSMRSIQMITKRARFFVPPLWANGPSCRAHPRLSLSGRLDQDHQCPLMGEYRTIYARSEPYRF